MQWYFYMLYAIHVTWAPVPLYMIHTQLFTVGVNHLTSHTAVRHIAVRPLLPDAGYNEWMVNECKNLKITRSSAIADKPRDAGL